jgi:hypothetical protein
VLAMAATCASNWEMGRPRRLPAGSKRHAISPRPTARAACTPLGPSEP